MTLSDFTELSADELRYYLQQPGQSYSGTHGVLAAKALIAHEQGLPVMLLAEKKPQVSIFLIPKRN